MIPTSIGFHILEHTLPGTYSRRKFLETHGREKGSYIVSAPRRPFHKGDRATVMGYWDDRGFTWADSTYYGGRIEVLTHPNRRADCAQWVSHDPYEESEEFKALLLRLPHGRFLTATSPGVGWFVVIDPEVYTDEDDAKRAAWELADRQAELDLEDKLRDREEQAREESEDATE